MDWVRVESQSTSSDGEVEYYYMNTKTKETTWDRPNDVEGEIPVYGRKYTGKVKEQVEDDDDNTTKPEDWWAVKTDSGEVYYMHRRTKTTTWDKPCEGEIEEYGKVYAAKKEDPKDQEDDKIEKKEKVVEEDTKEEDDRDLKKAYVDVKNVEGLNPSKAPRRIALSVLKQKWIVRTTGEGGGDADVYYLNVETGATSWDKPKDFGDDKSAKYLGIEFDMDEDLESNLKDLDFMGSDATKDRNAMIQKRDSEAEKRVYSRLQSLHKLMSECGEDETWRELLEADDHSLLRAIVQNLGVGTSSDVRSYAIRALSFADDLCPEMTVKFMKDELGGLDEVWKHVEQGYREAVSLCGHLGHEEGDPKADTVSIREISELLVGIVMYVRVEKESSRPSSSLLDTMFSVMDTPLPQKIFMTMSKCVCEINSLHDGPAKQNPVMQAIASNPKSEHWSEALVYELNETETEDEETLKIIVRVVIDVYAEKTTSNFFYTNDMNVLVDILIRELSDLPMESDLRVDFLVALENLIQNSPWFSKGQYRKDDIRDTLDGILEAYEGDSTFSKAAYVVFVCLDLYLSLPFTLIVPHTHFRYEKAKSVLEGSGDLLKD